MTRLEFNELVERLADRYEDRPAALAQATAVWIALGHAALFSGLVASLALGLGLMGLGWWLGAQWSFILVAVGAVIAVFGVAMSVRLLWSLQPPQKERVLQPDDAPRLFELIEDVRHAAGCRPFHRVLLKCDVNAGVSSAWDPGWPDVAGDRVAAHGGGDAGGTARHLGS